MRTRQLAENRHIDAMTWAAERAGMSYGKFAQTLPPGGREQVYEEYRRYLIEKERKMRMNADKTQQQ